MLIYNINLKKLTVTIFLAFNAAHQSTIQHSLLGVSAAPVVSINGYNISEEDIDASNNDASATSFSNGISNNNVSTFKIYLYLL